MVYQWTQVDPDTKIEFEVRTVLLENLASDYHSELLSEDSKYYGDKIVTSALMVYALNNPSYMLEMDMNTKTSLAPLTALGTHPRSRKLPTVTRKLSNIVHI